jgi:hypothetical protein
MTIQNITEIPNPNNRNIIPIKEIQDIYLPNVIDKNIPNRNGFIWLLSGSGGSGSGAGNLNNIKCKANNRTLKNKIIQPKNEVFNISNNTFTYGEAQAVCNAYGAQVATYDQIEKAYNNGAEWCNYGWSDGQMIYYPTQKDTWDKLQKNPNTKNSCGRPGINGGYVDNPYLTFGVNCYGPKPTPSQQDLCEINYNKNKIVPKSKCDIELEKKVNYYKSNPTILKINSNNYDNWSQFNN